VAAILRQRIADGELTGRLPGERYMAADYGVAVGTIRKAVALLREEGLVETVHGWGSYVHGHRPPTAGY
jgi:GntR family transcriptional regulator